MHIFIIRIIKHFGVFVRAVLRHRSIFRNNYFNLNEQGSYENLYHSCFFIAKRKGAISIREELQSMVQIIELYGRGFMGLKRDDLLNLVWGYEFVGDEKGVNFHIMNLRRKLGVDYIETARGWDIELRRKNKFPRSKLRGIECRPHYI